MIRIYNHNRMYRLDALDGTHVMVAANAFSEIDEKYTYCPTYKMAVAAKEIEPFETAKQGDKIEEKAHTRKKAAADK